MALIKEMITDGGPASYWIIGLIQLDNFSKTAYIRLYGFFNKQHADLLNPIPVANMELNIQRDLFNQYFDNKILTQLGKSPHAMAYSLIKNSDIDFNGQMVNFIDAIDEIEGETDG